MRRAKTVLLPKLTKILEEMGENIKLARLRRKLSAEQVAERAGISRSTLWQVEKGLASVSFGTYAQILFVLSLENDLRLIAKDDVLGRKLQDAGLPIRKRAPKKAYNSDI
ncbi:MAG: helix-turn-helix domain-containing protein [Bacteroidales bacterium]|jgi:transcriptional regulator with XRE-family HTH domain|nr:helix-turn-helix domain-containing protein [Bacteroidales bacterium]